MGNEVSLVIQNPVEGNFLKTIEWNKQEFMDIVSSITAQYQGLTYTDDQIKAAKVDRATLNSMRKAISDRRIQVKNEIMKPYTIFEEEVKKVVALIDEPISLIDSQIKAYEEKVKEDKKNELCSFFEEIAGNLEILTFERVFDQRYLNTTVSLKKAKDDIQGKVERVKNDLNTIENMEDEVKFIAKNVYSQTLDMSKAMMEVTRVQEMKRREAEEKARREEEARLREEARRKAAEEAEEARRKAAEEEIKRLQEIQNHPDQENKVEVEEENEAHVADSSEMEIKNEQFIHHEEEKKVQGKSLGIDKIYKASFVVKGTREQILALKQYMIENRIEFGKVEM